MSVELIHNDWPLQRDIPHIDGQPGYGEWERKNIVYVRCPWKLYAGHAQVPSIQVNRRCSESLKRVLDSVWEAAGQDQTVIEKEHCHLFSGSFVIRPMRGGHAPSMHGYGRAIDWNDADNAQHAHKHFFTRDSLLIAKFLAEGWEWGGDWGGQWIDPMHVQAARVHDYWIGPKQAPIVVQTPAPAPAKSETNMPLQVSQEAFNLIVSEEDSDQQYYIRHYEHFDWPAGSSGPTVGIGYDCGYVTEAELVKDWAAIVSNETLAVLKRAIGLKAGLASQFVRKHGHEVTITWEQAIKQFQDRELPKWCAVVKAHLPNTELLHPSCFGALVSLAYNRGPSFSAPGSRYAEMRSIRTHMATKNFAAIPGDLLSMRRLWPAGGDLWRRRAHEAQLFKDGLNGIGTPLRVPPAPGTPVPPPIVPTPAPVLPPAPAAPAVQKPVQPQVPVPAQSANGLVNWWHRLFN